MLTQSSDPPIYKQNKDLQTTKNFWTFTKCIRNFIKTVESFLYLRRIIEVYKSWNLAIRKIIYEKYSLLNNITACSVLRHVNIYTVWNTVAAFTVTWLCCSIKFNILMNPSLIMIIAVNSIWDERQQYPYFLFSRISRLWLRSFQNRLLWAMRNWIDLYCECFVGSLKVCSVT